MTSLTRRRLGARPTHSPATNRAEEPVAHVTRVGYVGLQVANVARAVSFYTRVLGLVKTHQDATGAVYLRAASEPYSLVLRRGPVPGLSHIGLEVASGSLAAIERRLRQRAIRVTRPPGAVGRALRVHDPAGLCVELFEGTTSLADRTVAGAFDIRKFSHVTLKAPSAEAMAGFYTQSLGFRVSDWVERRFVWMRCNTDHHGVAVIGSTARPGLHHLAYEVTDWGELKRACDHLHRHGVRLEAGPVRHGPGNNLAIYFRDIDGLRVELTCEMEQILHGDDRSLTWPPTGTFNLWNGASAPSSWAE